MWEFIQTLRINGSLSLGCDSCLESNELLLSFTGATLDYRYPGVNTQSTKKKSLSIRQALLELMTNGSHVHSIRIGQNIT